MNMFCKFYVSKSDQKGSFALQLNRMVSVDENIALKLINFNFN